MRVSLQPIPTYAPLWIAKRKGWLQEALQEAGQGSVQWSTMRDGPLQNEAFAAGLIDVALTADTPAIIGRAAGLDIEVVALAATSPASLAILVPSDSPAKSMADLKGKKIAATKGSFCHHLLALALQRDGLSLSDVQFINMSGPEINVSLQTGQIDAGVTWEPYISQILSSGKMRVLMDGAGLKSGNEVIAVNKTLVEQSPEVVQTILAAFQRGHQFLQEHPNEAAKLIAEDVNLEPAQVEEAFNKIIFFPKIDEGTMSEFEATQKFLHELGVNRKTVDIAQFVDLQFQSATAP
ncbi:aliphatic sulfonate ABC transporter substrate-binding protein [Blastopirellula sp. JC732]|uniref:Putative aliphatic sulfonates-binding protein n=1 Tax=Blastopirellula sediminis TaxID=2894196 RepID=A0A9X1ML95_9BACT|nr:aliphatic sulfonate ABC transporter substrate-binding protein [Blastopirellula sediminis]